MKCKMLLWLCVLILTSCEKEKGVKREASSIPSLTKTILVSSKGGKKIWRLTSERIKIKEGKTLFYNVKFEIFQGEKRVCTIRGEKGEIASSLISLFGNVIASTEEGATLTTSSINFNEKSNVLSTDGAISFIKGPLLLKGNGIIANSKMSDITIKKDVEVFFRNK